MRPFATSRTGSDYRARFLTTGNDYKDANYSGGSAPTNRAMAQATCGTAGVSNGYGAVASNPNGDNYITYKGTYTGSQSRRTTVVQVLLQNRCSICRH